MLLIHGQVKDSRDEWESVNYEAPWLRIGLCLNCTCTVIPFWEEMFPWPWAYFSRSDDVTWSPYMFLVEGPNVCMKKVLNFVGSRHVISSVDKVIDICSGCIQGEFYDPSFWWESYTHADMGGLNSGHFCVLCSCSFQCLGKVIILVSKWNLT